MFIIVHDKKLFKSHWNTIQRSPQGILPWRPAKTHFNQNAFLNTIN